MRTSGARLSSRTNRPCCERNTTSLEPDSEGSPRQRIGSPSPKTTSSVHRDEWQRICPRSTDSITSLPNRGCSRSVSRARWRPWYGKSSSNSSRDRATELMIGRPVSSSTPSRRSHTLADSGGVTGSGGGAPTGTPGSASTATRLASHVCRACSSSATRAFCCAQSAPSARPEIVQPPKSPARKIAMRSRLPRSDNGCIPRGTLDVRITRHDGRVKTRAARRSWTPRRPRP